MKYFEEDNLHVLAGTDICFSVPVVDDLEVKKWPNKTYSNVIAPL